MLERLKVENPSQLWSEEVTTVEKRPESSNVMALKIEERAKGPLEAEKGLAWIVSRVIKKKPALWYCPDPWAVWDFWPTGLKDDEYVFEASRFEGICDSNDRKHTQIPGCTFSLPFKVSFNKQNSLLYVNTFINIFLSQMLLCPTWEIFSCAKN